jgi:hypothetical protein
MLGLSADSRKMWVRNQSDPFVLRHWVPGRSDWAGEIAAQFQWQESAAELLGPQASGLIDFGVDAEDRLWLLHRLPRDGWRWDDVPPTPSGERLITIEQMGEYFVTRLDVFDLEGRRHEGTATLESGTAKLLMIAGRMLVHTVELDEFIVPRAVLHEIRVPR